MIKVEKVVGFYPCDSCGKKWDDSFRKVTIMGGARYIVIKFVLCGGCFDKLKEMF